MASHFDPFKEAFALLEDGGWGGWPRDGPGGLGKGGGGPGEDQVPYGPCALSRLAKNDGPLTCHFSLAPPTGGCGLALLVAVPLASVRGTAGALGRQKKACPLSGQALWVWGVFPSGP